MKKRALVGPLLLALSCGATASQSSCTAHKELPVGVQSFAIDIVRVNDEEPPTPDAPLPANTGDRLEFWDIEVQAIGADGGPTEFDGYVRLGVQPGAIGAVVAVETATGEKLGRNIVLSGGKGSFRVAVTGVYGEARLWAEDLGYVPAKEGATPACSNGKDDDGDVGVDFPNDDGCAFADDDSEEPGVFAAGVSEPVHYELPSVRNVQGGASVTPYPFEAIEVNTSGEHELVVTRISKDGFYVTDLADAALGQNHLFAFNFSTPRGMRVCDRVTYLSGTVSEFFGFTELNFPSFDVEPLFEGEEDKCKVPEPEVLEAETIDDPVAMERFEAGLVRVEGFHVAANFGPKLALNNKFEPDQSNCDFNGDGRIDFESEAEGSCGNACTNDPECSEWTAYLSRGNYKVTKSGGGATAVIIVQTDGAPEFNPLAHRGEDVTAITGTLKNFSGGSLNWTIEARCPDDVVCGYTGCSEKVKGPKEACVDLRTIGDNDEASN